MLTQIFQAEIKMVVMGDTLLTFLNTLENSDIWQRKAVRRTSTRSGVASITPSLMGLLTLTLTVWNSIQKQKFTGSPSTTGAFLNHECRTNHK